MWTSRKRLARAARPDRVAREYAAVGDLKRMSTQTPRGPQAAYFCPDPAASLEEPTLGVAVLADVRFHSYRSFSRYLIEVC